MRKIAATIAAATVLGGAAGQATASQPDTVVDAVIGASGTEGFDHNGNDYDLLREALVATGLVGAVAEA